MNQFMINFSFEIAVAIVIIGATILVSELVSGIIDFAESKQRKKEEQQKYIKRIEELDQIEKDLKDIKKIMNI